MYLGNHGEPRSLHLGGCSWATSVHDPTKRDLMARMGSDSRTCAGLMKQTRDLQLLPPPSLPEISGEPTGPERHIIGREASTTFNPLSPCVIVSYPCAKGCYLLGRRLDYTWFYPSYALTRFSISPCLLFPTFSGPR